MQIHSLLLTILFQKITNSEFTPSSGKKEKAFRSLMIKNEFAQNLIDLSFKTEITVLNYR